MQRKCRIVIVIDSSDGDKHQQINDCSGSRAMFGKYRKVLWMMPITCNEPGRPWHELEVPACQNLDIADWVCNFLPFRGCTTLHNMVQVPKRLLYKCWCSPVSSGVFLNPRTRPRFNVQDRPFARTYLTTADHSEILSAILAGCGVYNRAANYIPVVTTAIWLDSHASRFVINSSSTFGRWACDTDWNQIFSLLLWICKKSCLSWYT